METEKKSILQSKTFYGIVVSVLAKAATIWLGYEIDEETQAQVLQLITTMVGLGGDAFALYGRITAKKSIA